MIPHVTPHDALHDLLVGLQFLFANEGRPGGTEVAIALGDAAQALCEHPLPLTETALPWAELADAGADPLAAVAAAAAPLIPWVHAGLEDGKIPEAVARRMLTAELVGPDGVVFHPSVRAGLFYQGPQVDYPIRSHEAEETFIMLAGEGHWCRGDIAHAPEGPGAVLHHPSFTRHGSRTGARPLLAAWRWTGAIGWESYRCA